MSARGRPSRGMTLVELLTVTVLVAVTATLAGAYLSRSRGAAGGEFARALLGLVNEARHAAWTRGLPARVQLVPGAPAQVLGEVRDDQDASRWRPLGGALQAPAGVQLCAVTAATGLTRATPTCPLASAVTVCFSPGGRVGTSDSGACPGPTPASGATIYLQAGGGARRYKLALYGLTGMPLLVDQW